MSDFLTRLVEEREDLVERLNKLTEFIHSKDFRTLRQQDQALLMIQQGTMMTLTIILLQRINRAGGTQGLPN